MKIDKVILSSDTNPLYLDFWPTVSKVWKEIFKIEPILALIHNNDLNIDNKYGTIIRFEIIKDIPIYLQSLWIRYWITSQFKDDVCIISDLDMIPLSKFYFIDQIKNICNNDYVHLNPCFVDYGTLPSCYHVAKGYLFKEILELHNNWEDSIKHLYNLNIGNDPGGSLSGKNHWFADEKYSSEKIFQFKVKHPNRVHLIERENGRRIDRVNWNYDLDKLYSNWYYDSHSIRPYSLYKKEIDYLINNLNRNGSNPKILYIILTCEKHLTTRCKWIKNTWLNYIEDGDDYIFLSSISNVKDKIIGYNTNDSYEYATFKYVELLKNYEIGDFDHIFFCDDDTFVNTRKLKNKLSDLKNYKCYGRTGVAYSNPVIKNNNTDYFPIKFSSGGAGFAITRNVFIKLKTYILNNNYPIFLNTDVSMGCWLKDLNIEILEGRDLLKAQNPDHLENRNVSEFISYHYCSEEHFKILYLTTYYPKISYDRNIVKIFETNNIKASAIVSTYNSEKFIRGCLEDLVNQTLYKKGQLEIIIIDSASMQNEKAVVEKYQAAYPNIIYHRTQEKETLYSAWNRGIKLARGKYITNANTDDRHRPDALEILCSALDEDQTIDMVYADCKQSTIENETFEQCSGEIIYNYPDYFAPNALLYYQFGPQPVWRLSVHEKIGYFNPNLSAVGDYDFNLRFALAGLKAKKIEEVLGVFYLNPASITNTTENQQNEKRFVQKYYTNEANILKLYQSSGWNLRTNWDMANALNNLGISSIQFKLPWSNKYDSNFELAFLCFTSAKRYLSPSKQLDNNIVELHAILTKGLKIDPLRFMRNLDSNNGHRRSAANKNNKNKTITVVAGDGDNFTFVKPVMDYLSKKGFIIKTYLAREINDKNIKNILNQSDLIWYEWGNGPVVEMSNLYKSCPAICRVHRYEAYQEPISKINWYNINKLIMVNKSFVDVITKNWDMNLLYKTDVEIIPNPVSSKGQFKERKNNFNIAHISRFHNDKNPILMIQILQKLVAIDSRYKVFMIGGIQDQQLYEQCIELVDHLGLKDNFVYQGVIKNVDEWLEDKSFLLSTSLVESQGLAIMEAMYMGIKPVIHNGLGLIHTYPQNLLFNTADEAVRLITELEYDSYSYKLLVEEKFSDKVVLPKIEKLINDLISSYADDKNENVVQKLNMENKSKYYPLISICIPTYNRAELLKEALQSILKQKYKNYEIVIVDDGSTGDTEKVIREFNSQKIRYIKKEHEGRPKTRNRLIKEANGEYILWLGDDDLLDENILTEYSEILQKDSSIDVIYGNLQMFDSGSGKDLQLIIPLDYTYDNKHILSNLISGIGITDGGSLVRKSLYATYGYYDEEYLRAQDNEFWSRIGAEAKFYKVNKTVYRYRLHKDNVSFANFVDRSYESKTIRRILNKYPLLEVFRDSDYEAAILAVAKGLYQFNDFYNASKILGEITTISKKDHLELLFNCLLNSGKLEDSEKITNDAEGKFQLEFLSSFKKRLEISISFREDVNYLLSQKDYGKIKDLIEKFINKMGYNYDAARAIVKVLLAMGDNKHAFDHLRNMLLMDPVDEEYYNTIMKLAENEKQKDDILKMKNRLLEKISLFNEIKGLKNISEKPLITVIIPTHNRKDKLKDAVESVLQQTYENLEIIVVNDAGEDISELINSFNNKRVKLITHKENKGLAAARNTGLKNARGKYIAYLDDDDIYYPDHLNTLVSFLENRKLKVAYADAYRAKQELKDGIYVTIEKDVPFSNDFSKENLLRLNIAPVQCFMHEKACIDETGLFDESLKAHEDWDFWIRLSEKYEFHHLNKITSEFRQRTDKSNMTSLQNRDFYNSYRDIVTKHYKLAKDNPQLLAEQVNNLFIIKQRAIQAGQLPKPDGRIEVSIIIPVYNKVEFTMQCLHMLYKNTPAELNFEVIVVDNASTDGTKQYLEFAKKVFDNLSVITNHENIGFAKANNLGVKNAKGEYVIFLNNDTEPLPGWMQALCEVVENDSEVAAVGSKLLFPDGSLQHAGVIIIEDKQLPDPLVARHIYWKAPSDIHEANQLKTYQALTAACLLVKKSEFDSVSGFDEEYWNGYEDVDLCFKLGEAGYKMVYQPASVVIHHESQSGQERFAKVNYNIERLHKKWLGKIKPDFILEKDGKGIKTNAGIIKDYILPKGKNSNKSLNNSNGIEVSIVALTFNGLKYTRQFIDSIKSYTKNKYELIIIDNCSTDGTIKYLEKLGNDNSNIKIIYNKQNEGFPKGINQGIKAASGKYIVVANNDIVVTKSWLERLIEVAESDEKIGLVGPISNAVSGVQLDKDAKYQDIEKMHAYARKVKKNNFGKTLRFPRVAFLCTLIKREVIDKIGGLDERFSPGNFEDDDFCLRAQLAGYKTLIAQDVFIHHYGSKSFSAEGTDKYNQLLEANQKKFIDKWGGTPEEIWLKGKQIKGNNIMVTIDKDEFVETLEKAISYINEKDYASALKYLKSTIEMYDQYENTDQKPDLTNLLNLTGNISVLAKDYSSAQRYFEKALNNDNASSLACSGLGDVFFVSGNYTAAKTMYEWGVKNDSSNTAAISGLAKTNLQLNLLAGDNSLLKEERQSNISDAVFNEMETDSTKLIDEAYELFNQKAFDSALNKLAQAERLFNGQLSNPTDKSFASSFYNMKGFIYLGLNEIVKARDCFERALNINPESSQACAGLGEVFFLTEHDKQAKKMYEWAIKNNPENNFALAGLAKVNKLLGYSEDDSSLNDESGKESFDIKISHRDEFGYLFNRLGLSGRGIEIGVQKGEYSQTLRSTWNGNELYLVDFWRYNPDYDDIANLSDDKQKELYLSVVKKFADDISVQIIRKDSIAASKQFPDEFFDWIYIDADHSLEGCTKDLNTWFPKLKPGGVLAGHDYLDGKFYFGNFGVKSAVDSFIKKINTKLYITEEANFKSWYFIKPNSGSNTNYLDVENQNSIANSKDLKKLQSTLNGILEASFELFGLKHFEEAIESLKKTELIFYAQDDKALISAFENMKGLNYLGMGENNKARESYEAALNINPESSQACAGLGELFYLEGKDKEAKTMYEYAVKYNLENQFAVGGLKKINKILGLPETDNSLLQYN